MSADGSTRRTAHDLVVYTAGLAMPGVFNFATVALHTRLLSTSEYGRYAAAIAAATIGQTLLFQWLSAGLMRFTVATSSSPEQRADVIATVRRTAALIIAVALAAAITIAWLTDAGYVAATTAFCCALGWYELNVALARSVDAPRRFVRLTAARSAGVALVSTALAAATGDGMVTLFGGALALALATVSMRRSWAGSGRAAMAVVKSLAGFGAPLGLATLLSTATAQADRLFISGLVSLAALGTYAAAQSLAQQSISLLIAGVSMATYSRFMVGVDQDSTRPAGALVSRLGLLLLAIGLPAAVALSILAPNVVHLALGQSYHAGAGAVVTSIAAASLFAGLREYHYGRVFQATRRTRALPVVLASGLLLSVVLNALLVSRYGVSGALVSVVVVQAVLLLAVGTLAHRQLAIPTPWRELGKLCAAVAAMCVALVPFRGPAPALLTVAAVVCGAAAYATSLLVLDFAGIRHSVRSVIRSHA